MSAPQQGGDQDWLADMAGYVGEPGTASAELIAKRGHPTKASLELIGEFKILSEAGALIPDSRMTIEVRDAAVAVVRFEVAFAEWSRLIVERHEVDSKFGLSWLWIDHGRRLRDELVAAMSRVQDLDG